MLEKIISYTFGLDIRSDIERSARLLFILESYDPITEWEVIRNLHGNFVHEYLYRILQWSAMASAYNYISRGEYEFGAIATGSFLLAFLWGKRAKKARKNFLNYLELETLRHH